MEGAGDGTAFMVSLSWQLFTVYIWSLFFTCFPYFFSDFSVVFSDRTFDGLVSPNLSVSSCLGKNHVMCVLGVVSIGGVF